MPSTTVIRTAKTAPPLNVSYEFVDGERKFVGIVREVRAVNKWRQETERILDAGENGVVALQAVGLAA